METGSLELAAGSGGRFYHLKLQRRSLTWALQYSKRYVSSILFYSTTLACPIVHELAAKCLADFERLKQSENAQLGRSSELNENNAH